MVVSTASLLVDSIQSGNWGDVVQIELIKDFRSWRDSFSMLQVIGNVEKNDHHLT
jgi:hypothetical protein